MSSTPSVKGTSSGFPSFQATTTSSPESTSSSTVSPIGGIVGGTFGGVLLLAVLIFGLICWGTKYLKHAIKRRHTQEQNITELGVEEQFGGWSEMQEQTTDEQSPDNEATMVSGQIGGRLGPPEIFEQASGRLGDSAGRELPGGRLGGVQRVS